MKLTYNCLIIVFLTFNFSFAQEFNAQIIDAVNHNPIAYATIQVKDDKGVISNQEGHFSIDFMYNDQTQLKFSCLGYENKIVNIKTIKSNNYIVKLDEAVNTLNEVFINSKKPTAEGIIKKVTERLDSNYVSGFSKHKIFHRSANYSKFNTLKFEIDKASSFKKKENVSANKSLDSITSVFKKNSTKYFSDFLGNIVTNDSNTSKIKVLKATELLDESRGTSFESIQKKAKQIILKYLDENKYYKIKSGLFTIEDSLNIKKEIEDEKNREKTFDTKHYNVLANTLLKKAKFYKNSFLSKILDSRLYNYTLDDITYYDGELIYIISYYPNKAKAKYTGKLYITDEDYAVLKIDYQFFDEKKGSGMNLKWLLGVKFKQNVNTGLVSYKKNTITNIYEPNYISETKGAYFYINRPLKFIEQSGSKSKVKFEFIIEGKTTNTTELLCLTSQLIATETYKTFKETKKTPYIKLKQYDPEIWKDEITIEPLNEMKKFKSN